MREATPLQLHELLTHDSTLWATLTFEPRQRRFHLAKAALHRLGATYSPELRAWSVPVTDATFAVLPRLYHRTSLALFVLEPGEEPTTATFER